MLFFHLGTALISLSLVAADAFMGCVSDSAVTPAVGTSVQGTIAGCKSYCASVLSGEGTRFLFYKAGNGACTCSSLAPSASYAWGGQADPSSLTCGQSSYWQFWNIKTSYTFNNQCFDSISAPITQSDQGTVVGCLEACKSYRVAYIQADMDQQLFRCRCASSTSQSGPVSPCSYQWFQYTHTPGSSVSGYAKRQLKERLEKERLEHAQFCPQGLSACLVGPVDSTNYECLDTKSELESCGGCRHGIFGSSLEDSMSLKGMDCSALEGVQAGWSTCVNGQCEAYKCEDGYELVEARCVEMTLQQDGKIDDGLGATLLREAAALLVQ